MNVPCTLFTSLILLFSLTLFSQTVSTIVGPNVNVDDGMIVDNDGNIYVSRYSGSTVSKVTPDGTLSTFADGFNTPNGLEIDAEGNIYVADALGGRIYRISQDGIVDTLVFNITNPSGLAFNATLDTLYVSQCTISRISKVALDGTVTTLIGGNGLNCPVGLEFDSEQNLIIGNFTGGNILKYENSALTVIGNVPPFLGFITIIEDHIFGTSFNANKIYRMAPGGSVEEFAGTGIAGLVDGPADSARFNAPNGIASSRTGDTLYVSDWNSRSLRMITGNVLTGIEGWKPVRPKLFTLKQNYPNPFNPTTTIRYSLSAAGIVKLNIYDIQGRQVKQLASGNSQSAGSHELVWNGTDDFGVAVASGVYLYRLSITDQRSRRTGFQQTRKMVLMR